MTVIPHNKPTLEHEEKSAANRVIDSSWLAQGKEVEAFEREFSNYHDLDDGHAVALSSGTAALYLALLHTGLQCEHLAIPVYTCSAIRNAANMAHCKLHYIDCADTPNMESQNIQHPAIFAHMYGITTNLSAMTTPVIEDCAQSLGARIGNVFAGLQSKIGVFSFYATKMITSGGQGGMLLSRDKALIDQIKDYRDFDCRRDTKSRFNFQMTDLQAAIGREQLMKLPIFLERRREILNKYNAYGLPIYNYDQCQQGSVPYRALVQVRNPKQLISELARKEISAIIPLEDWELLCRTQPFPKANGFAKSLVSIPIYPTLSNDDVDKIARATLNFLEHDNDPIH